MNSPFKLLDAYTLDDRDVFWGRTQEVNDLYALATKNRLVLVYGQSGTGKTSLIQCGLAARFDVTDWLPLLIRRQDDLNETLQQRLEQLLGHPLKGNLPAAIEALYLNYLRPVYLVFDQLEELFILGTAAERAQFVSNLRTLLDAGAACRVLLVIREEYLAHLYEFERVVPALFDCRLRVETMTRNKVTEVLDGSFRRYNIEVENPRDSTLSLMLDQLSDGKAGIQLPYLQVYLDRLYREDFARTYPGQTPGGASGADWQPVVFTRAEVEALGGMEHVLQKFLAEQQTTLQTELEQRFPGAVEAGLVSKVLDAFASEEGTKRPIGYTWEGESLRVEPRWTALFPPSATPDVLGHCCRLLEQARLLRFADQHLELAHDTLAALLESRRTAEQRQVQESLRLLTNAWRDHQSTGEYLTRRQLAVLDGVLPLLEPRLDTGLRRFVADSEAHVSALEHAELEAERQKRRQARRVAVLGLALAGLALVGVVLVGWQYTVVRRSQQQVLQNLVRYELSNARTLKVEGHYPEALARLDAVRQLSQDLSSGEPGTLVLDQLSTTWRGIQERVGGGNGQVAQGALREALLSYEAANALEPDAHLQSLLEKTRAELESRFSDHLSKGSTQLRNGQKALAAENFRQALLLKPDDPVAKELLARATQ